MKRCLVADDNPDLRSALRLVMETRFAEIDVCEAADWAQVFDRVAAAPLDCLLLDWELPGLEAAAGLAALRRAEPRLRIIVISARPEAAAEAQAAQADAFV
ncbi:MAG: response regulator, partial [Thermoflexales bacterium]|nr:response regulator [Thermoflexales bacterium]